ncbi:MAG TPA: helix-turn-helix transcriptional regulator [Caulobacteraceae bacterium]
MTSIIFSDEYELLPRYLIEQRRRAGLSQRELADRMRRSQSHVYKMETRQRRIELIEFCRYVESLGGDPAEALEGFLARLAGARAGAEPMEKAA